MIKTDNRNKVSLIHKRIPVLGTQHFDIIWRKTLSYYRDKQRDVIDRTLDIIDKYPDFKFAFQQANVLRHYVSQNPHNDERLKRAVKNGQIEIVGGIEAIPDSNIPCGESLVRNILYGKQWVKEYFGVEPKVGTMLDAFGSSGQLPQVLSKMGYKAFLSGRMPGANFPETGNTSLFIWEGIDGSEIAGINCAYASIPQANLGAWYGWGVLEGFDKQYADCPVPSEIFRRDIIDGLKNICKETDVEKNIVAVISGEEHLPREEFMEALREHNDDSQCIAVSSRFDHFVENADWNDVDRLAGDYNVEFTGCYTTRIKLKQLNRIAEAKLYGAEFLNASESLGGVKNDYCDQFAQLWRKLAFCQFHDALCGCHIDENYHHLINAFDEVISGADDCIKKSLAGGSSNPLFLVLANINPFDVVEVVRTAKIENAIIDEKGGRVLSQDDGEGTVVLASLESGGRCCYNITDKKNDESVKLKEMPADGITAGRFVITKSGEHITITDTITSQKLVDGGRIGARLVVKEENGTLWTEDYSGLSFTEYSSHSKLEGIDSGAVFVKISYAGSFGEGDVKWDSFKSLKWRKIFYVYRCIDRIEVDIELFYEGKGTEVCIEFDCDIDVVKAQSRYEIPFGSLIRRPYEKDTYRFGRGNWPALGWVNYGDDVRGVTIAHTGTPGCLAKDGKVSFSLLRSATYYNEPLFPARPEELSFDNGRHFYKFALIPNASDDRSLLQKVRSFTHKPVAEISACDANANPAFAGISIDAANVVLSSLKPAEDGRGVIVRVYEAMGRKTSFSLKVKNADCRIVRTNMDESRDYGEVDGNGIDITPYQISTFRIIPVSL